MLSGPKLLNADLNNPDLMLTSIEWTWDIKNHKLEVDRVALGQLLHS